MRVHGRGGEKRIAWEWSGRIEGKKRATLGRRFQRWRVIWANDVCRACLSAS